MLAICDKNGEVHASIPGLARVAGISVEDAESAINKFMSPDKYSRTSDNEGRRIAAINGGWELLNHAKYRLMASKEDQKTANADRVRRHRARNANVTQCNANVTHRRDIADTDTNTDITLTKVKDNKEKETTPFLIPENATEKDALIKGSANKNKKARFNTPLMIRIGSWFGRREDTIWTNQETQALIDASPTPAQIDGMERFYMAEETSPPTLHHKHSLITMLNNWNTELDKARKYALDQARKNQ